MACFEAAGKREPSVRSWLKRVPANASPCCFQTESPIWRSFVEARPAARSPLSIFKRQRSLSNRSPDGLSWRFLNDKESMGGVVSQLIHQAIFPVEIRLHCVA